jgi:hypothetical protein
MLNLLYGVLLLRQLVISACASIIMAAGTISVQPTEATKDASAQGSIPFDLARVAPFETEITGYIKPGKPDELFVIDIQEADTYCIQRVKGRSGLNFRLLDSRQAEIGNGRYIVRHLTPGRHYLILEAGEYDPGQHYSFFIAKTARLAAIEELRFTPEELLFAREEQQKLEDEIMKRNAEELKEPSLEEWVKARKLSDLGYLAIILAYFALIFYLATRPAVRYFLGRSNADEPAKRPLLASLALGTIGIVPFILTIFMFMAAAGGNNAGCMGCLFFLGCLLFLPPTAYGLFLGIKAKKMLAEAGHQTGIAVWGIALNAIGLMLPLSILLLIMLAQGSFLLRHH